MSSGLEMLGSAAVPLCRIKRLKVTMKNTPEAYRTTRTSSKEIPVLRPSLL